MTSIVSFVAAFGLGVIATVAALAYVVWRYVLADGDGLAGARRKARLQFVESVLPDVAEPASMGSSEAPVGPESAVWFNQLLSLMYREIFSDGTFHTFVTARLEKSFNKDRPSWLSPIKVDQHDFGTVCSTMEAISLRVCGPDDAHQLDGTFRVNWLGHASIRLSTAVHVLSKSLPINARVAIARIAGTMRYTVTKGDDPLLYLGFTALPVVVVDVETEFGSSLSISNLPKVGSYVSGKIESMIGEELLRPNGGIIAHIPIPHVRYMMPMRFVKYHKKKRTAYKPRDKIDRLLTKLRTDTSTAAQPAKPHHLPTHSASLPPVPSRPATPVQHSPPAVPSPPARSRDATPPALVAPVTAAASAATAVAVAAADDSLTARFGRWTGEKLGTWMSSEPAAPAQPAALPPLQPHQHPHHAHNNNHNNNNINHGAQLPQVPPRPQRVPEEQRPAEATAPAAIHHEVPPHVRAAEDRPRASSAPTQPVDIPAAVASASRASTGAVNASVDEF